MIYMKKLEYLKENKLITEKEGIALTDPLDVKITQVFWWTLGFIN